RRRRARVRPHPPASLRAWRDAAGRGGRPGPWRLAGADRARVALRPGAHRRGLGGLVLGMTAPRRAGLVALALGLLAAALLHSKSAPPVFDGIIVPPEPYRWVSPPPNLAAGNKPPLPGEVTLPIQNGQVAGGGPQTGDSQVVMYFAPATFKAPSGAQSVKCTIDPLA